VLLIFIGVWLRMQMEDVAKQQVADMLQMVLHANTEALQSWSITMKTDAENLAEDDWVRELVLGLAQKAKSSPDAKAGLAGSSGSGTMIRFAAT
jgi:hypothetical protein